MFACMQTNTRGLQEHEACSLDAAPCVGLNILSVDDLPIQSLPPYPLSRTAPGLLHELFAAQSAEQRRDVMSAAVERLGFNRLTYERFRIIDGRPVMTSLYVCVGDQEWSRWYWTARFQSIDPRLSHALGSSLPIRWNLQSLRQTSSDVDPDSLGVFLRALHVAGLRSGAMLAIKGPVRGERSIISLSAPTPEHAVSGDALIKSALLLGLAMHAFFTACDQSPPEPAVVAPALGSQQLRILQGLARGLTDREIAVELALSRHGVDYHLRQLRKFFNTRNRIELVQAALGVRRL